MREVGATLAMVVVHFETVFAALLGTGDTRILTDFFPVSDLSPFIT
jgi:hypothetical protein